MSEFSKADVKAGACVYILHMLLQRLEVTHAGILEELLTSAKADQSACRAHLSTSAIGSQIFNEAISVLELIQAQNTLGSQSDGAAQTE